MMPEVLGLIGELGLAIGSLAAVIGLVWLLARYEQRYFDRTHPQERE